MIVLMIISIASLPYVQGMRINEIMYNPEGDDNNREFVEVFMDAPINLTGYIIADSTSNDTLTLLQWKPSAYALIVEEGFNFTAIDASVYSAGSTIGNNLDNTGDSVTLFMPNGTLQDTVTYNSLLANNNGKSLEFVDGAWLESSTQGGSPGKQNTATAMPQNSGNQTAGNVTLNGTTIQNGTNGTNGTLGTIVNDSSSCKPLFSVATDKVLYAAGEKVKLLFNVTPEEGNFSITYWIEDLQQNIVKEPRTTANTNAKSFTPDAIVGDQSFLLRANATICARILFQESLFTVIGNVSAHNDTSSIQILSVATQEDDSARWGEAVKVHLTAYRGNTQKSVIVMSIISEKTKAHVSQTSKVTLGAKYTTLETDVPIQLKPNCDGKFDDGNYTLIAQGLDKVTQQKIYIEGTITDLCPATNQASKAVTQKGTASQKDTDKIPATDDTVDTLAVTLLDVPEEFDPGIAAETIVRMKNTNDAPVTIALWSYVAKGTKIYSGKQDDNTQDITLQSGEEKDVTLENTVTAAKPGTYNLTIKVLPKGKKTPKIVKSEVEVLPQIQSEAATVSTLLRPLDTQIHAGIIEGKASKTMLQPVSTTLVFDSRSAKIRRSIPYALIIICFITIIVLVVRDTRTSG